MQQHDAPSPEQLREAYERAHEACTAARSAGVLPRDIEQTWPNVLGALRRVPGQPYHRPPPAPRVDDTPPPADQRALYDAINIHRARAERALAAAREARVQRAGTAIRTEAMRVGWPLTFWTDVAHDIAAIARYGGEPFGWVLHADGSHYLAPSGPLDAHMVAQHTPSDARWYYWDRSSLRHLSGWLEAARLLRGEGVA